MAILKPAVRTALFVATIIFTVSACLVSHWVLSARAAQRTVLAEDARVGRTVAGDSNLAGAKTPVLVELFTSEGCSDCPPADALLARLGHDQPVSNADIIILEEHVDYWESLGWHDRFSSHELTDRQSRYAHQLHLEDNYTPQMIVDGTDQFVGSDSGRALRSIAQASHATKVALALSPIGIDSGHITGSVQLAAAGNPAPSGDLLAAVVQTTASTDVGRGENSGRTLHHVSVVRSMRRIGTANGATSTVKFTLPVPGDVSPDQLQVVVFVQAPDQGPILGAASSERAGASPAGGAVASADAPRKQ